MNSFLFLLKTELVLKVRLMDEHQVITGSIKDLSISAGIYNPMKRSDWIYKVKISIILYKSSSFDFPSSVRKI